MIAQKIEIIAYQLQIKQYFNYLVRDFYQYI